MSRKSLSKVEMFYSVLSFLNSVEPKFQFPVYPACLVGYENIVLWLGISHSLMVPDPMVSLGLYLLVLPFSS